MSISYYVPLPHNKEEYIDLPKRQCPGTHLDFMTPDDVLQVIVLQEPSRHVRPELTAHTSLTGRPAEAWLGVGPEELAHDPFLGRLLVSLRGLDVRQADVVLAEQTSVHHQHLGVSNVILQTPEGKELIMNNIF